MTIINRLYPELSDILAVQLECRNCHATISYPTACWKPASLKCPNCSVTLVTGPEAHSKELSALSELAHSLKQLSDCETLAFQVRLELRM
jgi:hypothetical protein